MKESFFRSANISKEEMRAMMERRDGPGLVRFVIQYGLFLASAFGIVYFWENNLWLWGTSMALNSLMVLCLFAMVHESGHNTAFKTRWLGQLVTWISAASHFYTPIGFRQLHFAHHRYTHDPHRDPEISIAGKPAPKVDSSLPFYFGFLSGVPIMMFKIMMIVTASLGPALIWEKIMPFVAKNKRSQLRWQSRFVLSLNLLVVAAGIFWTPAFFWLYAAQVGGHSIMAMYTTAEHTGLPNEGNILERTRTTHTNALVRFLVWNMPYHAEHHAYPAVPFHALPKLHEHLKSELVHTVNGYPVFQGRMIKGIASGKGWVEK